MITIKFPKSPKSPQRKRVQKIAEKNLNYSEDDLDSIIKSDKINKDLIEVLKIIRNWSGTNSFIDEEEIEPKYLLDLFECSKDKIPSTILRWYGLTSLSTDKDIIELKEQIDKLNNGEDVFLGLDYQLKRLQDISLISVVEYKKEYNVEKEKFKEEIINKIVVIKKIFPEFEGSKVLSVIDTFPEKIIIKNENDDDETLELLRKIEKNTRT